MTDDIAQLSELSDQSSDENAGESSNKSGDKGLDQGAQNLLNTRGYKDGAQSTDMDPKDGKNDDGLRRSTRTSARLQATQTQKEEVVKSVAPYAPKTPTDRSNGLQNPEATNLALRAIPQSHEKVSQLMETVKQQGSTDILALDPSDRLTGYSELEAWVDGSVDMYKVC
jgi:transcription initiation factor TFIID subunit 5